jgi:hypothetical protein
MITRFTYFSFKYTSQPKKTMRHLHKRIFSSLLSLCFLLAFANCTKEQISEEVEEQLPINSFGIEVNGKAMEPGQIGNNECLRTYYGAWSARGNKPYFNIVAYVNPEGLKSDTARSRLDIQIMNVTGLGKYELTGSYLGNLEPYAYLSLKKPDGSSVRYLNKKGIASFYVEIEKFIPLPKTNLQGVIGSLHGTLYNEKNPADSIIIRRGKFTFNKTNHYDYNQCENYIPISR